MNYYWVKVSVIALIVLNVAQAAFLIYQNQNTVSIDDVRVPSIISKLKGEFQVGAEKAKAYTDELSHKASKEAAVFQKKTEQWRDEVDARVKKLEAEARKRS